MFIVAKCGFLTRAGRGGMAGEKFRKLEDWAGAAGAEDARMEATEAGAARVAGTRVAGRFLAAWPFNVVIMTFITHKSSKGPWTSAVQGPKLLKYL